MGTTENKKSYEDLDIYKIAIDLAIEVHKISLEDLPKFEIYEEGSQIRRSSKIDWRKYCRRIWQKTLQGRVYSIFNLCDWHRC